MARSACASPVLLAREGTYAQVRLRSGEVRRVHIECRATIGEVGNEEKRVRQIGKAGGMRRRGVRPTVQLGRASCRDRGGPYGKLSVVAGTFKRQPYPHEPNRA